MALRTELQEFVDEVTGKLHPGEPLNVHLHHCAREFFDVVGLAINAEANVDELANEAVAAASAVLAKLNLGVVARRIASSALPWVIPPLVEQLAQFSGTAQEFVDAHVVPRLELWIDTLTGIRDDLKGAA